MDRSGSGTDAVEQECDFIRERQWKVEGAGMVAVAIGGEGFMNEPLRLSDHRKVRTDKGGKPPLGGDSSVIVP